MLVVTRQMMDVAMRHVAMMMSVPVTTMPVVMVRHAQVMRGA